MVQMNQAWVPREHVMRTGLKWLLVLAARTIVGTVAAVVLLLTRMGDLAIAKVTRELGE